MKQELLRNYPMGPAVREYLGIKEEDYNGYDTKEIDEHEQATFIGFFTRFVGENPISDQDQFIDLLEELTAMSLSFLTIKLAEINDKFDLSDDFRALTAIGAAALMEREFDQALELFESAQAIEPDELSPYVNISEILYSQHKDEEAEKWVKLGLKADPNHFRLWELFASIQITKDKAAAGETTKKMAKKVHSFAGLSLAAELINSSDYLLKAQYLEEVWNEGQRGDQFLREYTASLGLAQQFEKIPVVILEQEKIGEAIHWELYSHGIQAYLAMENEQAAKEMLQKVEKNPALPENIKKDLQATYEAQLAENNS
ncbi:MAG: hypothetical protein CMP10_05895 [Zetaproteobacteria bacterium]|nr:hypothetical protein [Pseudobdellovibrionaceae bacterium]